MGTNIEGRLIALEIERKRLSERLERALSDIADLKQFRRTAPGLGWNWGGTGQAGYYCLADAVIEGLGGSGTGNIYQGPADGLVAASATIYNSTGIPITPYTRCPVMTTGGYWIAVMPPPAIGAANISLGGGGEPGSGPTTTTGTVYVYGGGSFVSIADQAFANIGAAAVPLGWHVCVASGDGTWIVVDV